MLVSGMKCTLILMSIMEIAQLVFKIRPNKMLKLSGVLRFCVTNITYAAFMDQHSNTSCLKLNFHDITRKSMHLTWFMSLVKISLDILHARN